MNEYYTTDGEQVSPDEIRQAVAEQRALAIWSHSNWENRAVLAIYATPDEASTAHNRLDTRGHCYSVWDETWPEWPTPERALRAATGALRVS